MFLRKSAMLANLHTGAEESALFMSLDQNVARVKIDQDWWQVQPGGSVGKGEEDSHWCWEAICSEAGKNSYSMTTCIQTNDGRVQGAIVYNLEARSSLVPEAGAVFVDQLATAPWNRGSVTARPEFRGVGSELLLQAVHHSYLLGLKGRVTLLSLPGSVGFYQSKGFVGIGPEFRKLLPLELPSDHALDWLKEKRMVGK